MVPRQSKIDEQLKNKRNQLTAQHLIQFSKAIHDYNTKSLSTSMSEAAQPEAQPQPTLTTKALKLYVYGSCESDQYYHPSGGTESRRPICLSEVQQFKVNQGDDEKPVEKIIQNPFLKEEIYQITCGALHTVVLTTEGTVYTFGCNDEGALGREGIESIPMKVELDGPMDMISAGDNHSVFANSQLGCIYFAGSYKFLRGQKMVEPVKVPERHDLAAIDSRLRNTTIQKLVSGSNHTAFLIGGKVFLRGEPEAHTVGRRINERHKLKSSMQFDSVGLTGVVDVWCGGYHTIAKVKKGNSFIYYAWGLNKHGQLGIGNYEENPYPVEIKKMRGKDIREVAAGTNFTIFLTEERELFGCGQNDDGQLGLGQNYEFVDSEEEQNKKIEQEIEQKVQKMALQDPNASKQVIQAEPAPAIPSDGQAQPKPAVQAQPEQISVEKPHLVEENLYIKSIRPIPIDDEVDHITAGSQFAFGYNEKSLYSWGFGMNYVLLNGQEEDEYEPFKVKGRILNEEKIYTLAAGAQHVVYLAVPVNTQSQRLELTASAKRLTLQAKDKLNRRKKSVKK